MEHGSIQSRQMQRTPALLTGIASRVMHQRCLTIRCDSSVGEITQTMVLVLLATFLCTCSLAFPPLPALKVHRVRLQPSDFAIGKMVATLRTLSQVSMT